MEGKSGPNSALHSISMLSDEIRRSIRAETGIGTEAALLGWAEWLRRRAGPLRWLPAAC